MPIPSLEETLQRLATSFTVRDIMIPAENLICAPREKDAPTVSAENPDLNVIPIKPHKQIRGYYERDSGETKLITPHDLISDGTSILDLVKILAKQGFYFVLAQCQIAGYVHFSDLNNRVVKLTIYTIIEALESHALTSLGSPIDEEFLRKSLGRGRFERIKFLFEKARRKDANRSWADFLNIEDILWLAVKSGKIRLPEHMIEDIGRVRNKVAHQVRPLINEQQDAALLERVIRQCCQALG
jgi:hypothetical protein